ncbi:MAG: hypothetical protein ACOVMG_00975 [Flavobacterium sp.]
MKTIEKITFEKQAVNWTSTKFNTRMCYFTDGGKIEVSPLLSEIGNSGLDNWRNVEKVKKSTSNKNIQKYLSQFINKLETCK